jgi:hypothetical protein
MQFLPVLSLLIKAVEPRLSNHELRWVIKGSYLLIISCVPAYFLSTLWAEPGRVFNIIGFLSALTQLLALLSFMKPFRLYMEMARQPHTRWMLLFSFVALFFKCILQVFSAHPAIAVLAAEFRSIVIAYLHLVLLGFISIFLIGGLEINGIITANIRKSVMLIMFGFIGSELLLVMTPWVNALPEIDIMSIQKIIFVFSLMLVFGIGSLALDFKKKVSQP